VEQRLLGVVDVQHSITDYFNVDKIRILQIVANQLSIALTNAQLFAENERRLAIIENSAELIALVSLEDGRVIYVNPVGTRLAGYNSPAEIIGQKAAIFAPEHRV
jgi:GAF domain-containing protein